MLSTLKVNGIWKGGFRIDVTGEDHTLIVDQPENSGGKNDGPNPLEVLLFALASCLGTVAVIVARQERIELRSFEIEVEGDLEKAYLMGKTTEGRAGYTEIRVLAHIDADLSEEEKQAFFKKVEDRCPVTDNLVKNSKVEFGLK